MLLTGKFLTQVAGVLGKRDEREQKARNQQLGLVGKALGIAGASTLTYLAYQAYKRTVDSWEAQGPMDSEFPELIDDGRPADPDLPEVQFPEIVERAEGPKAALPPALPEGAPARALPKPKPLPSIEAPRVVNQLMLPGESIGEFRGEVRPKGTMAEPRGRNVATHSYTVERAMGGRLGALLSITGSAEEKRQALAIYREKGSKAFEPGDYSKMNPSVRQTVIDAANRYKIPPSWMLTMMRIESGGNPYAISSTGAAGLFQFTGGTANLYHLKNRLDPAANADAAARLTRASINAFRDMGVEPTLADVYLAHQQGMKGAKDLHRLAKAGAGVKDLTDEQRKAMKVNFGVMTPAEYLEKNRQVATAKWQAAMKAEEQYVQGNTSPVKEAKAPEVKVVVEAAPKKAPAQRPTPSPTTSTKVSQNSTPSGYVVTPDGVLLSM